MPFFQPARSTVPDVTETGVLLSPVDGRVIPLSRVPDEVFASGILGVGAAVEPTGAQIYSPAEGQILSVAATRHAYTIQTKEGLSLLVHIGIDTVALQGEGFEALVQEGDFVCAGTPIARIEPTKLRAKGCPLTVPILLCDIEPPPRIELLTEQAEGGKTPILRYWICKEQ